MSVRPPTPGPALRDWIAGVAVSSALYGILLAVWSLPASPPRVPGGAGSHDLWVELGADPGAGGTGRHAAARAPGGEAGEPPSEAASPAPARPAASALPRALPAVSAPPRTARPPDHAVASPSSRPPLAAPTGPVSDAARATGSAKASAVAAAEATGRLAGRGAGGPAGPAGTGAAEETGTGGGGEGSSAASAGSGTGHGDPAIEAYFARLFGAARHSLERRYPGTADEGVVLLRVQIDRGGRIRRCEVVESSGSAVLDRAAVRDFRRAGPFGPVPEGASSRDLLFDYPVEYALARPGQPR